LDSWPIPILGADETATLGRVAAPAGFPAAIGGRRRDVSLLAGSVCTRFGLLEAGQQSARDPRYTVVLQRERLGVGVRRAGWPIG
jgi:hypothetical protein